MWHRALTNHVLQKDLPLVRAHNHVRGDDGYRYILTIGEVGLERLTVASVRASQTWLMKHPKKKHTTLFHTGLTGRVFRLFFLDIQTPFHTARPPDFEGRFLLSLGHTADHNLCVQVWDTESPMLTEILDPIPLTGRNPGLVSEWTERGRAIGIAVDEGDRLQAWASRDEIPEEHKDGAIFGISERQFEA